MSEYKVTAILTKEVTTTFTDDGVLDLTDQAHDALEFDYSNVIGSQEISEIEVTKIE